MDSRRQSQDFLNFLGVAQVPAGQRRAQPQRAGRQQHILHRRVDGRAGGTGRRLCPVVLAGDNPHRRLVVVLGQVLHRVVLAAVSARGGTWRRLAAPVARAHHLVKGFLIPDLHPLLDAAVFDDQEPPALVGAAVGRPLAGLQDAQNQLVGNRVGFQPAHGAGGLHDVEQVGVFRHGANLRGFRIAAVVFPERRSSPREDTAC